MPITVVLTIQILTFLSGFQFFKPSVTQPISQATNDLNSNLLILYSSHVLNNEPFSNQTILDHLDTELVHHSDPHCTGSGIPVVVQIPDKTIVYRTFDNQAYFKH